MSQPITIPKKYIPSDTDLLTMTEGEYIDSIEDELSNAKAMGKFKTATWRQYQTKYERSEPYLRQHFHDIYKKTHQDYQSDLV